MINLAGPINCYRKSIKKEKPNNLNWERHVFDVHTGLFKYDSNKKDPILASYTNPRNNSRIYLYHKEGFDFEVSQDWGRYLVLQDLNKSVLQYDSRRHILGVQATFPLPKLFARALTLCSGYASLVYEEGSDGVQWRYFRYVPKQISELIGCKLAQRLTEYSMEHLKLGQELC